MVEGLDVGVRTTSTDMWKRPCVDLSLTDCRPHELEAAFLTVCGREKLDVVAQAPIAGRGGSVSWCSRCGAHKNMV